MTTDRKIACWLFISAAAVFLMALIGAITRLTESGLSIVEWKPVTGVLPPPGEAAWIAEFDLYKQSPQYQQINAGMTLEEFKNIFFWEWLHRFWGRMIGLVYAVPLLFFWRNIPQEKRKFFVGILILGFLQGAMGWYMVKSGLVDRPSVSHYRLAAHLMLAFIIYGCLFRLGLSFAWKPEKGAERSNTLRPLMHGAILLSGLTMMWGAFVAGLDAGLLYNTFPKMDAYWIPPELAQHQPMWEAFFEEPATVQFTHRLLAILTFAKVLLLMLKGLKTNPTPRARKAFIAAAAAVALQAVLGIGTLLSHVNIHMAVAHQAGALILLGVLLWLLHEVPCVKEKK